MALTSPKMGLNIWNLLSDPYDHAQLADNLSKIDLHDHTPGRGVQIPTEGIADGAITSAKLTTSLDPTLGYATYKDVIRSSGNLTGGSGGLVYLTQWNTTGTAMVTGTQFARPAAFYLNTADYAISGRSTVFRTRFTVLTNSVAPTNNFVAGLYPILTYSGTNVEVSIASLDTVVASSTAVVAAPAAGPGPITSVKSADFAVPTAGWYALGVAIGGTQAANSHVTCLTTLQVRQI